MSATVCPVCENKFYTEEDYFVNNSALHGYCARREGSSDQLEKNPVRTSTPISELENGSSSFADSVTDFFYQSWKSGLHSNDTSANQRFFEHPNHQYQPDIQPMYSTPQVIYFNTVIYQAFTQCSYVQPVGYRPDGTFGVLPTYWGYLGN